MNKVVINRDGVIFDETKKLKRIVSYGPYDRAKGWEPLLAGLLKSRKKFKPISQDLKDYLTNWLEDDN